MLFLHLPEALQTLPALRDIRDGPVELLGQRLVRVLGPAVSLQAAELLVIFFCPGPRYFWGSSGVAGIGVSGWPLRCACGPRVAGVTESRLVVEGRPESPS